MIVDVVFYASCLLCVLVVVFVYGAFHAEPNRVIPNLGEVIKSKQAVPNQFQQSRDAKFCSSLRVVQSFLPSGVPGASECRTRCLKVAGEENVLQDGASFAENRQGDTR